MLASLVALQVSFQTYLWRSGNFDYGSISSAGLLITMLVFWKLSRMRLKGLLELLGSTDGKGSGTLEGNSLASNIGYLLNKYSATWDARGLILSQDLAALRHVVDRLERLSANNEDDHEEAATVPHKHLNAPLLDDHEEEDEGDDF